MPIRLGGMISGLDTDAIVKELMSAQSLKKTSIEQKKTKLDWKKEKWEELNTKMYSLYTEKLSALKLQGSYLTKKASSSDESKVKATASNASNGTYSIEIKQLASSQYVTGADISEKHLKKNSLLKDAGMSVGQTISIGTSKINSETGLREPATTTIEIKEDTTVSDLLGKLGEAGLNASFDENTGRFYISAKESGENGKFTLSSSVTGAGGLSEIGLEEITDDLALNGRVATDASQVAVVAATDAEIILNGAHISSSNNTLNVTESGVDRKNC